MKANVGEDAGKSVEGKNDLCAALSLSTCFKLLDISVPIENLNRLCGDKGDQTTLLDCSRAVQELGYRSAGFRWRQMPPDSTLKTAPAIMRVILLDGRSHFISVAGATSDELLILDYPYPPAWIPTEELRDKWHWDGTLLHIARDSEAIRDLRMIASLRNYTIVTLVAACCIAGAFIWIWRERLSRLK